MSNPGVTIIIPHRNQPQQLRKCLMQLMELGYSELSILVVDNGSNPFPVFANEFPVRILQANSKPSPYVARNLGISLTSTEIIVLLDVNAIVQPGWLENGLKLLREDNIVSGLALPPAAPKLDAFQRFDYLHSVISPGSSGFLRALPATNLFFHKKVWEEVGPFREVRSLGDMEWTSRAYQMGYTLIADPSVAFTYPFKTGKSFSAKYRRLGGGHAENDFHRNKIAYVIKNFLPPSPDFVRRMNRINQKEGMNLSQFQIIALCYWVKVNYAIGFLKKTMRSTHANIPC